ncbi:MAG: BamA/TamA family outer membrane protein [Candidatus Latescibacteria bacterium]|nr:BamA/TamA family outer membrane protein [Candidatus Latescibacterota bacterium]
MPWILLILSIAVLPAHARRAYEEKGWKSTAIPLVNFSSDHGTGYGLRTSLFLYDGHTVPYARALSAQAFFTTRGKWAHRLYLDLPHWRPNQRLEIEALYEKEDFSNYYADLSDAEVDQLLGTVDEETEEQRTTFRQVYPKLRLMWIRTLDAPWYLRAGFQVGHNEITPNADDSLLDLLNPLGARGGFLLLANTSLRRDTRDDYNDSNRGSLEELLIEYGAGGGGEFHGGRLSFEHRHFHPLPGGLVLAQRANLALTFGDLPFYEELKLGGDDSVRGLAAARERGEGRVLLNAELRWPGLSPLPSLPVRGGLLCFFDAGQIFRRAEGPSLGDWRTGAGLGLRCHWHSTIIRADLGRSGERTGIYLNFSQVF